MRFTVLSAAVALSVTLCHGVDCSSPVSRLLAHLDSLIENEDEYARLKMERIADIRRDSDKARTLEEQYWYNRSLYNEYYVFEADSALSYVNRNLAIARALGNPEWENDCHIKRSFMFSVTGLLSDAEEELSLIDETSLSPELRSDYFGQLAYLYSHIGQLSDHRVGHRGSYDDMSRAFHDSALNTLPHSSPEYLWHKGETMFESPGMADRLLDTLRNRVDRSARNTRQDAINAYVLSRLYGDRGDLENRMRYLIVSGAIDVRTANRDIASLEELADLLEQEGDIDRAYNYINYCRQQALRLPNRIRAASLSRTETRIHSHYVEKLRTAGRRTRLILGVLAGVLVLLGVVAAALVNRSRRLMRSQQALSEANGRLNANLEALSQAREEQDAILARLREADERNRKVNLALNEANYVKEECIGATFALCASYIDRLGALRKTIGRLVRTNSWQELRDTVSAQGNGTAAELKEFYRSFDTLFLNIYPDFVHDFNELLCPDERVAARPGELTTELRIYALVRLGINDSVKIAALLHCSPQTVYNYRLRMRNKARIPKERFAEMVQSLGKFKAPDETAPDTLRTGDEEP